MSPIHLTSARVVAIAAALLSATAAGAEEEVRIELLSGEKKVNIEATDLAVFDAQVGDRLAFGKGKTEAVATAAKKTVKVSGSGLAVDENKKLVAANVFFEAKDGVLVNGHLYLGRIEVRSKKGRLWIINRLPLETYLLGIVGSEMNPTWPSEALKAQAVAARTYAMQRRMRMRAANRLYDLKSTVLSQVYKGADRIRPSVVEAVRQTRGEVVSHEHQLVEALFHSTCGGQTVSARSAFGNTVDYLVPRKCTWCTPSNKYRWKASVPLKAVSAGLRKAKLVKGTVVKIQRSEKDGSVKVTERGGRTKRLDPRAVRKALGFFKLYSSRFAARTRGKNIEFTGRGFGHGVGMCQWGAHGLSKKGHNYREILAHYYNGARIKRMY